MATAAFDTLKVAKQLKQSGFSDEQAETLSEVFRQSQDLQFETVATKADSAELRGDLKNLRSELKNDLAALRSELKNDLAALRSELKNDIAALRTELVERIARTEGRLTLIQWMLGFNLALTAAVLFKLLI